MSASTPFRLPRAAVFSAVCVGVSVGGHALSSGTAVPFPGVAAGFLLVLAVAWAVAARERGYGTILAWMLWGELALHLLFHQAQTRLAPPSAGPMPPAGHGAHHPPTGGVDIGDSSVSMLLAHLAAALVSAWYLRRGETAAFALARALRTLLVPPLLAWPHLPACAPPPVAVPTATVDSPALHGTVLPFIRSLRGPPLRRPPR